MIGAGDGDHAGRDHPVVRGVVGEREPVGGSCPQTPRREPLKAGGEAMDSRSAHHAGRASTEPQDVVKVASAPAPPRFGF